MNCAVNGKQHVEIIAKDVVDAEMLSNILHDVVQIQNGGSFFIPHTFLFVANRCLICANNQAHVHHFRFFHLINAPTCCLDQNKRSRCSHRIHILVIAEVGRKFKIVYTQLFNLLCDKADDVYGGKLPIHVRCLIDECANIGQIPNLEKLVATIRSREISACLVLQARSQLKAIYKDNADTIVGNMDSQIFLGGSEPTTLKDLSEMLGKETIDAFNTSDTRGNSPSYGTTFQKMGHELLSRDELAVLDGGKCILQLRGVRPFLSDKYDLTQHPNYKLTSDYDPKNIFDIEKYLNRKTKIHPGDEFIVVDADSLPSA